MNSFFVTITQPGGMSEKQLFACDAWFEFLKTKCVASHEKHKSGLMHFHAIVEDCNGASQGFKRKLMRGLREHLDFTPKNALDVRLVKAGEESRTAGYVVKDEDVFVCNGWSIKSLLAKRAKLLQKDVGKAPVSTFMLNEKNVEEIILEYATRMSLPLTCKQEFISVVVAMQVEGYSFSRIKPLLVYAQVLARAGSPEYARDWWEMKLGGQM